MTGMQQERFFVLPMDRRVAMALYVGLRMALGFKTG
jgi:hypothetical protein